MICLICRQANLAERLISVVFERDEIYLEVTGVPAWVCPNCGDSVVDEDVALRLLSAAEEVSTMGRNKIVLEYEKILN